MDNDFDCRCAASADSILDYGQYAILQSGLGHIMYSAATAQSTMDFSVKPINHGVVDSPPSGGKRPRPVSSPSPLKARAMPPSPNNRSSAVGPPQRKLYDDSEMKEDLIMVEVRVKLNTHSFLASHAFIVMRHSHILIRLLLGCSLQVEKSS